jgi:hypothetical protein
MTIATNEHEAEQRATAARTSVALAEELGDLDQAWRMSQALAQSSLLPQPLRNKPSDVLVTILYGQEIGLRPLQALNSIYVVNGRPSLSGQLWLAKAREAGHRVELVADDKSATCTITRGDTGEVHSETFTIADAERAKLAGKDVWRAFPKRMLGWRAVGHCATVACPEVALGWQITEVVDDAKQPKPTLAEVAKAREHVDTETGEIRDAEVVDDDAVRAEVEQIERANEPTEEDIAALNAEAAESAPDDTPPSGLFGVDS